MTLPDAPTRWTRALLLCVITLIASAEIAAQPATDPVDTQRFRPHATHDGVLSIEGATTRHPIDPWSVGFWMNYAHNPFVIANDGELITRIVGAQVAFNLTASYAFADWFELGVDLPMALLIGDDTDASSACAPDPCPTAGTEFGLGDIRLVPKITFLQDATDGFGLALIPEVRIPSHTSDFLGGARLPILDARLVADHRFALSGFRLLGELGATIRGASRYANVREGHELNLALGGAYRFDMGYSPIELLFDVHADIGLSETDAEEVSLEALLGLQVHLSHEWRLNVAGGPGLIQGYGTPSFRLLFGVRWSPSPHDPDGDGYSDEEQLEPYRDPDKDDDGEVDEKYDEDGDGEIDEEYDEDGDGKIDDDEARKEQMEDYRDPDKDGDGKVDEAYDKDGDGELDEAYDKDGDGKLDDDVVADEAAGDGVDLCPELPEDFDGVEDDDGCPEGDADGDGVLDIFDRCEDEAEVINGHEDDDGCPDEGPAQIVVEDGKIKVLATIRFKTSSDELTEDSKPILEQLVLVLRARQDVRRVRIEGHTDDTGSRDTNMRLSNQRARSVKAYLVERGIKSGRLEAIGFGPDRPIADNDTEEGRAKNRRVEFVIIQR